MSTETTKLKAKLAALVSSLADLEAQLEPLFAQTLPETLLGLEPLQQAKLQTALPYLVYDLIFIYLKSKGIDPRTHPVITELDRIRQYFEKISTAENPPAKRADIDKAAAGRFIKHAIAQSQWKKTAGEALQDADNAGASATTSSTAPVPVKITQKMRERAAYEQELKARDAMQGSDDEGSGLEVFDGAEGASMDLDVDMDGDRTGAKGKGKAVAMSSTVDVSNRNKRRRPAVDPFAGYGDDAVPSTSSGSKKVKSSSPSPPPSVTPPTTSSTSTSTPTPIPTSEKSQASTKKTKKKGKKSTS